jgi:hypothetical protein
MISEADNEVCSLPHLMHTQESFTGFNQDRSEGHFMLNVNYLPASLTPTPLNSNCIMYNSGFLEQVMKNAESFPIFW